MSSCLLVLLVTARLAAADPAALAPGATVEAAGLTTIALAGIPGSRVTLAPGSSLAAGTGADGALVLDLRRGQAEFDLPGHGAYPTVQVDAAFAHVTVTGTIFQVERGERRDDAVVLIAGRLTVTHRRAVAKALAERGADEVELSSRQGVSVGAAGLGAVARLQARPRLVAPLSLLEQMDAGLGLPFEVTPGSAGSDPAISAAIEAAIAASVEGMIADEVTYSVLGGGAGPGELGAPPAPPPGF